ncbi:hypothetical protein NC651_025565 [Populus alba x Populus x berolinensis]|nr:hypothetical protein NC651_025565 [Populus alba x Populus x berolinensis]
MDEVFSRMGGKVKSSITDSTIMSMLHSRMDKAHERVHSKEGVIARLHEISKFYELAVMQLEGCLKFVLEEADSSLESSDEEALGDLAEIRDRLEGRLIETELAIAEKDRELTERLENEMKLRHELELKERELESLRANYLELERTKTDGIEEQVLGNLVSGDGNRDEGFSELKDSVDQQVWNIKQQLDPEDENIDKRRYHGFESLRVEQMSSDMDILKETMGLAFEKMQNAIFLSELEPTEQQLGWTIEKAVIVILIKGFMGDIQENFTAEVRRWQKQVSIGLSKHLADLMKEITCLQDELEPLSISHSSRESRISTQMKGKSSSEGDISYTPDDFTVRVGKIDQMKQLNVEDSEEDGAHYVAKMIKSHETIIRRKSEELKLQKLEILKEKGCTCYRRSEKGPVSPRQRFRDVTAKLGNLLDWRENLDASFGYHGGEDHDETSSTKMLYHFDMKDHGTDALEKLNSISISHDANEKLHNVIRKLEMEKEDTNLQNVIVEDTYITLLEGLVHECCAELRSYDIAILVREGIYEHILKEIVNECDEKMQGDKIEDQITEEMFYLVSREALKDCCCTLDSVLTECRDVRAERNCFQEHALEATTREEILSTFFTEIFKDWNEAVERCDGESIVKEDIDRIAFEETIRDMASTRIVSKFKELNYPGNSVDCVAQGSSFFEDVEYSVKEDVFMVFLKEMSKEWKAEIDSYDYEILLREEIFILIVVEAMAETRTISGETTAQDRFRILEDFTSADKLHISQDIGKEEHLVQKQDSQPEHIKFENLKRQASPAMKEYKTPLHVVALKHEELNKSQHTRELLTEIDSTSISVCSEVKKALEQVAMSKGLLRELRSSLGVAVEDTERFDEEVKVNLSNSDLTPIQEFSQVLMDFKRIVEKKLVLNILRVEEATRYLNPLVELVSLQRREDLLYKKAFLRRCENLRRAETEVDLLGDQVDVLLSLLDKIYRTLYHYAPALQQFSEVSDILKMIEVELTGAAHIAKALEDKPILHGAILTTNQDFVSLKTFNNKNLRKPPLTDDKDVSKLLASEYTAAATMIKGEAILAKVDATVETMLAEKYNILAFPSSYFFVDGVRMDNHYLERTRLPWRTLLRWSNAFAIEVKTWMAFEVSMNNMRKKFLVDENELKEAQAKYDEDRQRWQEERKDLTASQSKIRGPSPLPFLFSVSVEKDTALEISRSMEANRGQNGIQLLLAAEQESQHIVNAARNEKMARLKQAKEEAGKEIAEFRAQMEAEFQRKLAESSGDSGANVKRLEQETEAKIGHLKKEAARISHDVVQMLLKHVTTVKN